MAVQLNTMIKLGSLAFNVANDEKVRQLAGMVHHGAKRRGLYQSYGHPQAKQAPQSASHPALPVHPHIPFAPVQTSSIATPPAATHPGFQVQKYLTMDNAKKALGFAGTVSNFLMK
jgi:hypothetical protein